MASIQKRGTKFQLRVVHKNLVRPYIRTFDSDADARDHGNQIEALLATTIAHPPAPLLRGAGTQLAAQGGGDGGWPWAHRHRRLQRRPNRPARVLALPLQH